MDLAVIQTAGPQGEERVYVANQLGETVSRLRVNPDGTLTRILPDRSAGEIFGLGFEPTALAARSDGRRLFIANGSAGVVSVWNLDPEDPLFQPDSWIKDIVTPGGDATRLTLPGLAEP